jgi:hypothetical protein
VKSNYLPWIIGGAVVVTGGMYAYYRYQRAGNVQITPRGLDFDKQKTNFFRIAFSVNLEILNPENFTTTINAVYFDVYLDGKKIANVNSLEKIQIPAKTAKNFDFTVTVPTFSLLSNIVNAIGQGLPKEAGIKGYVDTPAGRLPIDFKKLISL